MTMLQAQTFDWLSLLPTISSALVAAASALTATYLTLRHQRKVKSDELSASASLRARELMFGVYEKSLDDLMATADALGEALGAMQASASIDAGDEKVHAAVSRFFSVIYTRTLKLPEYIEETEAEMAELGLSGKFDEQLNYIKNHKFVPTVKDSQDPKEVMEHVYEDVLRPFSYMINIQRAILEARADELFSQYLPSKGTRKPQKT